MEQPDLLTRAARFAVQSHRRIDQRRKYTNQPYEVHLKAVATLVASVSEDPEVIAAAWLHDIVEDTPATYQDIEREFGPRVAQLVLEVTDVSRPSDGNRAVRKAIDREHLSRASPPAKTIKLADLVDNVRDVCGHDVRFAGVFVDEAGALLDILGEGDARLHRKAGELVDDCRRRLAILKARKAESLPAAAEQSINTAKRMAEHESARLFIAAFSAKSIAEPLRSFDADRDVESISQRMAALRLKVAGIREDGAVRCYVRAEDLSSTPATLPIRSFARDQVLPEEASLADVIQVLTRHEQCFVSAFGGVTAVITRAEIQRPIVRMWLFGIITFLEMDLVDRIRERWPGNSWAGFVTPSRLQKAEALREERRRRGQECELLDCLQISDKSRILLEDATQVTAFGFASRAAAKRVIRELESLRNNLAHGQDIVTHDWAQIARLALRVQELAQLDGEGAARRP